MRQCCALCAVRAVLRAVRFVVCAALQRPQGEPLELSQLPDAIEDACQAFHDLAGAGNAARLRALLSAVAAKHCASKPDTAEDGAGGAVAMDTGAEDKAATEIKAEKGGEDNTAADKGEVGTAAVDATAKDAAASSVEAGQGSSGVGIDVACDAKGVMSVVLEPISDKELRTVRRMRILITTHDVART